MKGIPTKYDAFIATFGTEEKVKKHEFKVGETVEIVESNIGVRSGEIGQITEIKLEYEFPYCVDTRRSGMGIWSIVKAVESKPSLRNLAIERDSDPKVNERVIEVLKGMGEETNTEYSWINDHAQWFGFSNEGIGNSKPAFYFLHDDELIGRTKITARSFITQYGGEEEKHIEPQSIGIINEAKKDLDEAIQRYGEPIKSLEEKTNMFKKGDIVECVDDQMAKGSLTIGRRYEVISGDGLIIDDDGDEYPWPFETSNNFKLVTPASGSNITNFFKSMLREVKGFIKKLDPVIQNFYRLEWVKLDPDGELKPTNAGVVALNKVGLKCVDYKTVEDYAEAEVKRIEKEEKKSKK